MIFAYPDGPSSIPAGGAACGRTCYRGRMILGLGLLLLGIVVLVRWIQNRRH